MRRNPQRFTHSRRKLIQRLLRHTKPLSKHLYKHIKPNLIRHKRQRSVLREQRLNLMGHVCSRVLFQVIAHHHLAIQRQPAAMVHRRAIHRHHLYQLNVRPGLRRNQTEPVCKAGAYQATAADQAMIQDQAIAAVLQATVADQAIAAEHPQTVLREQRPNLMEPVCKADQRRLSQVVQIIATLIQAVVSNFIQVMRRHPHNPMAIAQMEATVQEMITCQFASNLI